MKYNERLVSVLIIIFFFFISVETVIEKKRIEFLEKIEEEKIEIIRNILDKIDIKARAISIYDITENKKIYGKNDNIPLPIASLTKIMTVLVSQDLRKNEKEEKKYIQISKEALNQNGDSGFLLKEKWNIEELAKLTLVGSINDGAQALSETGGNFIEEMNAKAKRIGGSKTIFFNATGLDTNGQNTASAKDINNIAIFSLSAYPEILNTTALPEITLMSEDKKEYTIKNTNIIVNKIPNLLLSKTGYTDKAGGGIVVIFKNINDKKIAITILGSTFDDRFKDLEKIINIVNNI